MMMELDDALRLGRWLKKERVKRGMTQKALAKCVDSSQASISRWEFEGITLRYIYCGFRYFFERQDRFARQVGVFSEIPDNGKPQLATGAWLSWWMETENVSVKALAEKLDVSDSCVYRWKKPDTKLSILTEYAIRQAMKDLGK